MACYAGFFKIKPELEDEYVKAHDEIWPEMEEAIMESGFRNHSLFLGSGGRVIIYAEAEDLGKAMTALAGREVNRRWQAHMRKFFVETDENTGGVKMELFPEIYHLTEKE